VKASSGEIGAAVFIEKTSKVSKLDSPILEKFAQRFPDCQMGFGVSGEFKTEKRPFDGDFFGLYAIIEKVFSNNLSKCSDSLLTRCPQAIRLPPCPFARGGAVIRR
jgi:hypothetical protein